MKKWIILLIVLSVVYLLKYTFILMSAYGNLSFYVLRQFVCAISPIMLIVVFFRNRLLMLHHKFISGYLYFLIIATISIEDLMAQASFLPRVDFYKFVILPAGVFFCTLFICLDILINDLAKRRIIVKNIEDLKKLSIRSKISQIELLLSKESTCYNELIQLQFRYNYLDKSIIKGILFFNEQNVERNKINNDILSFIDSNKDFLKFASTESPAPS